MIIPVRIIFNYKDYAKPKRKYLLIELTSLCQLQDQSVISF